MLPCAKDKFHSALLHKLTYLIPGLLLFPTLEIPIPACVVWIAASYKQISTDHLICFTSCIQSFTSQCIPRQANLISITFGIEKRLYLGSVCACEWDINGVSVKALRVTLSDILYLRLALLKTHWNHKVSIVIYFPLQKTYIKESKQKY